MVTLVFLVLIGHVLLLLVIGQLAALREILVARLTLEYGNGGVLSMETCVVLYKAEGVVKIAAANQTAKNTK